MMRLGPVVLLIAAMMPGPFQTATAATASTSRTMMVTAATFFQARGARGDGAALDAGLRSGLRSGAPSARGGRGGDGARARASSWRPLQDGGRGGYSGLTEGSNS